MPDDKTSLTTFSQISDQLTEQLRTVIEEPLKPGDPKAFKIVKDLYAACMNKCTLRSPTRSSPHNFPTTSNITNCCSRDNLCLEFSIKVVLFEILFVIVLSRLVPIRGTGEKQLLQIPLKLL